MQQTVGDKQIHHHISRLACQLVCGNDCCGIGVGRCVLCGMIYHTSSNPPYGLIVVWYFLLSLGLRAVLGINRLTTLPPRSYCEIPGDVGVRIKKEG